jgi:hypothetical protein
LGEDLMSRAVALELRPPAKRLAEVDLWRKADELRPTLLAGICDCLSAALRNHGKVRIADKDDVRMHDFALWVLAAEPLLQQVPAFNGLSFLSLYKENRSQAAAELVANSPIGPYILQLADSESWEGTASDLLEEITNMVEDEYGEARARGKMRGKGWPATPDKLGRLLKRLAPQLKLCGVEIEWFHKDRKRLIRIEAAAPY